MKIDLVRATWPVTGPAHSLLRGVMLELSVEGEGEAARLHVELTFPDGRMSTATLPIRREIYSDGVANTFWWEEDRAREARFAAGYVAQLNQLAQRQSLADAEHAERMARFTAEQAERDARWAAEDRDRAAAIARQLADAAAEVEAKLATVAPTPQIAPFEP